MQASKRLRSRLKLNLQPPAKNIGPRRKDKTGLIFILLATSLVIAVILLV